MRKLVVVFAISMVLMLSVSSVSAFSFVDWFKDIWNTITGKVVEETKGFCAGSSCSDMAWPDYTPGDCEAGVIGGLPSELSCTPVCKDVNGGTQAFCDQFDGRNETNIEPCIGQVAGVCMWDGPYPDSLAWGDLPEEAFNCEPTTLCWITHQDTCTALVGKGYCDYTCEGGSCTDIIDETECINRACTWVFGGIRDCNIADVNYDGKVDVADLALYQANYDSVGTNQNTHAMGDMNQDGKIEGADLALYQANYDPAGIGECNSSIYAYVHPVVANPSAQSINLIANYKFTNDATDSVGSYDGIIKGSANIEGGKLVLDGGGYVRLETLPKCANKNVTICAWANRTGGGVNDPNFVFGQLGWHRGIEIRETAVRIPWWNTTKSYVGIESTGAYTNIWTHVCMTSERISGNSRINAYIDGANVGQEISKGNDFELCSYAGIGAASWPGGVGGYFVGEIDSVEVYDGVLSSLNIHDLYLNEKSDFGYELTENEILELGLVGEKISGEELIFEMVGTKKLDGVSDCFEYGDKEKYDYASDELTVMAWYNQSIGGTLVSRYSATPSQRSWILSSKALSVFGPCSPFNRMRTGLAADVGGGWHHIAATWTSDGFPVIYIDGAKQLNVETDSSLGWVTSNEAVVGAMCLGNQPIRVGCREGPGLTGFYKGDVANIKVYSGSLLGAKISEIYDMEKYSFLIEDELPVLEEETSGDAGGSYGTLPEDVFLDLGDCEPEWECSDWEDIACISYDFETLNEEVSQMVPEKQRTCRDLEGCAPNRQENERCDELKRIGVESVEKGIGEGGGKTFNIIDLGKLSKRLVFEIEDNRPSGLLDVTTGADIGFDIKIVL